MEAKNNLYWGIDLGTTNSVLGYGQLNSAGQLNVNIFETNRRTESGMNRRKTLPSAVMYDIGQSGQVNATVGDFAKSRYGMRPGFVSKSIKSKMGLTPDAGLDGSLPDHSPADVSAQILKFMMEQAGNRLITDKTDVVITVPASFDADQCQATLDAAKKAGINVDNQHDILLYEPKAVIYDFIRMQEKGEIPESLIDLSTPKNILVFDLGGGTLDVTIHHVAYNKNHDIEIRDLAVSRYSQIGGDNFDMLLANRLLKIFEEENGISVRKKARNEVLRRLQTAAENVKIEYSSDLIETRELGMVADRDKEYQVLDMSIYDDYALDTYLTAEDFEEIYAPLLAHNLVADDSRRMEKLSAKNMDNIVYPVLDALAKMGKDTKIDAVIMNGGMTKFPLVQDRIQTLLDLKPICCNDPDLAVARGAVYYHYCLHKYNVTRSVHTSSVNAMPVPPMAKAVNAPRYLISSILNDTISLGLQGEYITQIAPAGTELPFDSGLQDGLYKTSKQGKTIAVEFYLGRGTSKNLPNRKAATRLLHFDKLLQTGTKISFRLYIDAMRLMRLEAWVTGRRELSANLSIDMSGSRVDVESARAAQLLPAGQSRLNAQSEINILEGKLQPLKKKQSKGKLNEIYASADKRIELIASATNGADFYEPCWRLVQGTTGSEKLRGYMYRVAALHFGTWTERQQRNFIHAASEHFNLNFPTMVDAYVLGQAASLILRYAEHPADFFCTLLQHRDKKLGSNYPLLLSQLLVSESDAERLVTALSKCSESDVDTRNAYRIAFRCSAELSRLSQKERARVLPLLTKTLQTAENEKLQAALLYALAEVGDSREDGEQSNAAKAAIKLVQEMQFSGEDAKNKQRLALDMLRANEWDDGQQNFLDTIRQYTVEQLGIEEETK